MEGLVDLGLLIGDVDGIIERGDYRHLYMHRTGHWLGLDVLTWGVDGIIELGEHLYMHRTGHWLELDVHGAHR